MWNKDLKRIVELIKQGGFKSIYVTGYMKVGKSTFCKELHKQLPKYEYIEYDEEVKKPFYQNIEFRGDKLKMIINKYKDKYYILDYYRLLDETDGQGILKIWDKKAEILILLDPNHNPNIICNFLDKFKKLGGELIHKNTSTGAYVKLMQK